MHYVDGESAADIWVAFIEIPPSIDPNTTRNHSAKELAVKCKLPKPWRFIYEVVFEWAIPEKYMVHKVSLQTLMERGLQEQYYLRPDWDVWSTSEVQCIFAQRFPQHEPWEIGITLGAFAQKFGARAPSHWIAHQLFRDCVRAEILDDDVVELIYAHEDTSDPLWRPQIVDFQFLCDLDDGVDISLLDWWLKDIELYLEYKEFEELRDMIEDSITWDLIEFWETWHDIDYDGRIIELSAKECLAYCRAKTRLAVKHENKRAAVEAEAVKIGL